MTVKKMLKLINDERINNRITASKADSGNSCAYIDAAICTVNSQDHCIKDFAGCTNNSYDYCGDPEAGDFYACHSNNVDFE